MSLPPGLVSCGQGFAFPPPFLAWLPTGKLVQGGFLEEGRTRTLRGRWALVG